MKKDIHPTYNNKAKVICACGSEFITGSTVEEIHIELCDSCHPFYTGKQKLIDTAGRVDKFKELSAKKEKLAHVRGKKVKKAAQKKKKAKVETKEPKKAVKKVVTKKTENKK